MRNPRGFTLLELMLVLAIIGIFAGLAAISFSGIKTRNTFSASAQSLTVTLRQAKTEALSRGSQVSMVFDTTTPRWWMIDDPSGALDMTTFNPASPVAAGQTLIDSGTISTPAVYSTTGYQVAGAAASLPAPFASVPVATTMSFCATGQTYCAITFLSSGGASFSSGSTLGGALTLADSTYTGTRHQFTYAVVQRTGLVETFEVGP